MAHLIETLCPVLKILGKENSSASNKKNTKYTSCGFRSELFGVSGSCHNLLINSSKIKDQLTVPYSRNTVQTNSGIFHGMQIVLELSSFQESKSRNTLRKNIINNGGQISYIITRDSNFVVCGAEGISKAKLISAFKYSVPVVLNSYIEESLEQGKLLPYEPYLYERKEKADAFQQGKISSCPVLTSAQNLNVLVQIHLSPTVRSTLESYDLVKYVQLAGIPKIQDGNKTKTFRFATIELHVRKLKDSADIFCVFVHEGEIYEGKETELSGNTLGQFVVTAREAISLYCTLYQKMTGPPKFLRVSNRPLNNEVGSLAFQALQKRRRFSTDDVDSKILFLVSVAWKEVQSYLSSFLTKPSSCYPEWKVRESQRLLIQLSVALSKGKNGIVTRLSKEFYKLLSFKPEYSVPLNSFDAIVSKLHLCSVLVNVSSLTEACSQNLTERPYTLVTGLGCQVSSLQLESEEYKELFEMVINSQNTDIGLIVHNIFSVKRNLEAANFDTRLPNVKLLYHGTHPSNLLNILYTGLRPPVSTLLNLCSSGGSDERLLGYGIYFSDSINACLRFCEASERGTRFLLVTRVALGRVYETRNSEPSLCSAPDGFDTVLGVKTDDGRQSVFQENEYVIYKECQQELCYLIEFSLESDNVSPPKFDFTTECSKKPLDYFCALQSEESSYRVDELYQKCESKNENICSLTFKNSSSQSTTIPLKSTHVRARIVDLVAEVTVFQVYKNSEAVTSEVQYTFPLCEGAAVCGFEAFIGNKHIVGQVKEKEIAHTEYNQAVKEGHGAYLLDEEKPDVFTARLGNLPANTKTIIKITYIAELSVESDALRTTFPSSFLPPTKNLPNQMPASERETVSFEACIEMATNIQSISSPTHPVMVKMTDTKAVVKIPPGCSWKNGLEISIRMCEVHIPRMWTEKHSQKESEVCMVTYYPEFEDLEGSKNKEILFFLDASNSMRGESFQTALTLIVLCLKNLNEHFKFNIVAFGTVFVELFPESLDYNEKNKMQAIEFLRNVMPNMGSADLLSPLMSCNMFTKFTQTNVFLISDGFVNNENTVVSFVSKLEHIRMFSLCVGQKSNRHFMMKSARCSGGSFEEYLPRLKGKWGNQVKEQVVKSGQQSLTNIEIEWQLFDQDGIHTVAAPKKIKSLFSGSFIVAYGFVSNCTLATLKAKIGKREYKTVVSTHKLNQLSGTLLHSLAAKACIDDWEDGLLEDENALQTAEKENSRENIVTMAQEYHLVSSLTSFIAVEKRQDGETITSDPSLEEVLKECNVDILPYLQYEPSAVIPSKKLYNSNFTEIRDSRDAYIEERQLKGISIAEEVVPLKRRAHRLETPFLSEIWDISTPTCDSGSQILPSNLQPSDNILDRIGKLESNIKRRKGFQYSKSAIIEQSHVIPISNSSRLIDVEEKSTCMDYSDDPNSRSRDRYEQPSYALPALMSRFENANQVKLSDTYIPFGRLSVPTNTTCITSYGAAAPSSTAPPLPSAISNFSSSVPFSSPKPAEGVTLQSAPTSYLASSCASQLLSGFGSQAISSSFGLTVPPLPPAISNFSSSVPFSSPMELESLSAPTPYPSGKPTSSLPLSSCASQLPCFGYEAISSSFGSTLSQSIMPPLCPNTSKTDLPMLSESQSNEVSHPVCGNVSVGFSNRRELESAPVVSPAPAVSSLFGSSHSVSQQVSGPFGKVRSPSSAAAGCCALPPGSSLFSKAPEKCLKGNTNDVHLDHTSSQPTLISQRPDPLATDQKKELGKWNLKSFLLPPPSPAHEFLQTTNLCSSSIYSPPLSGHSSYSKGESGSGSRSRSRSQSDSDSESLEDSAAEYKVIAQGAKVSKRLLISKRQFFSSSRSPSRENDSSSSSPDRPTARELASIDYENRGAEEEDMECCELESNSEESKNSFILDELVSLYEPLSSGEDLLSSNAVEGMLDCGVKYDSSFEKNLSLNSQMIDLLYLPAEINRSDEVLLITKNFIEDVLSHLGGGLPLCNLLLKSLFQEAHSDANLEKVVNTASVKYEMNDSDVFHKEDHERDSDSLSTPPYMEICLDFDKGRLKFLDMLKKSGLKSMGISICQSILELGSLLYVVFTYLYIFLIPAYISEDNGYPGFGQQEIVAKQLATYTAQHLTRGPSSGILGESFPKAAVAYIAYLKRISAIDKKYPLIYSSLGLGKSWEKAVCKVVLSHRKLKNY